MEKRYKTIYKLALPFSETIKVWDFRRKVYQGLLRRLNGKCKSPSNILRQVEAAGIYSPNQLTKLQCNDGIRYCKQRLIELRKTAKGLRRVHLRNCLIKAQDLKDKEKVKAIKRTINKEDRKRYGMLSTVQLMILDLEQHHESRK